MIAAYLLVMPICAFFSFCLIGPDTAISAEHPGGNALEIAFWSTSIGASFLSFMMMEVLFRSAETRNLASFPLPPLTMFGFQMGRVFKAILITTIPVICFWLPQAFGTDLSASWMRLAACVLIWPLGLGICAAISAAILLYTANNASNGTTAPQAALSFGAAPAIALAASLILTLLLKLLAEALLKPGFWGAAVTASLITAGAFAATFVYAAVMYHRHYYSILASFFDSDLIVINAGYDFLDSSDAEKIRETSSISQALCRALCIQYRRRCSAQSLLVITFGILFAAVLWGVPEYLSSLWVSGIAVVPYLLLAKPWLALRSPDLSAENLVAFPVETAVIRRTMMRAAITVSLPQILVLCAAVFLPGMIHLGIGTAAFYGAQTLVISAIATIVFDRIAEKSDRIASWLTYGAAAIITIIAVLH